MQNEKMLQAPNVRPNYLRPPLLKIPMMVPRPAGENYSPVDEELAEQKRREREELIFFVIRMVLIVVIFLALFLGVQCLFRVLHELRCRFVFFPGDGGFWL